MVDTESVSAEQPPSAVEAVGSRAAARRAAAPRASRSGTAAPPPVRTSPRGSIAAGAAGQTALRARLRDRLGGRDPGATVGQEGQVGLAPDDPLPGISVAVVDIEPPATDVETIADRVLTAMGSRLAGLVRSTDLVVRPWRTRFVLVLDGARDDYQLAATRRRITDALTPPVLVDGRPLRTTVRVGVVPAERSDTVDTVLARLGSAATRDQRPVRLRRAIGVVAPPV